MLIQRIELKSGNRIELKTALNLAPFFYTFILSDF
jgi:hypothetical protein